MVSCLQLWKKVLVVSVLFFAIALGGCGEEYEGLPPLMDDIQYPIDLAIDAQGDYLFVINSNFNLAHRFASIIPVDLKSRKIIKDKGISIDSFPSSMVLAGEDQDGHSTRGYVTVRGDNSLTWFNISWNGGSPALDCHEAGKDYAYKKCSGKFIVDRGLVEGEETEVGSDPMPLLFREGVTGEKDMVFVGTLRGGTIELFVLDDEGMPVMTDQLYQLEGLNSMVLHPSGYLAATSKYSGLLLLLGITDSDTNEPGIESQGVVSLPSTQSSTDYGRSVDTTTSGDRILVAYRTPPSLIILDATSDLLGTGAKPRVVRSIPLARQPSQVKSFPSGPDGRDLVYVVSLGDDSIYVVDPDAAVVVDKVLVGRTPYNIHFNPKRMEAYVTNFEGHSISVLDLDPESETYHQVIGEIK